MKPFGEYAPDQAQINTSYSSKAENVIAGANAYHAIKSPFWASYPLPETPKGAAMFHLGNGERVTFVGDKNSLYRKKYAKWLDVKSIKSDLEISEFWAFTQFGNLALATNGREAVQVYDLNKTEKFEPLKGNPPKAKYINIVGDYVVLAHVDGHGRKVHWSGTNDAETWEIGSKNSDIQIQPNGGEITGIVGGEHGYIFQEYAIRRMTPSSGRLIFTFDKISNDIGCKSPRSIVQHGNKIFFLANDGFYILEGDQLAPIGAQRVNKTFLKDCHPEQIENVQAAIDPKNQIIMWFYTDVKGRKYNPATNKVMIYNWLANKWSHGVMDCRCVVTDLSKPISFDDPHIPVTYGNLDEFNTPLDDPSLMGNELVISIFKNDKIQYNLTGLPMAATIESGDIQPVKGGRVFMSGVSVMSEAVNVSASVAVKERITDIAEFGDENTQEDTGIIPTHASGRFINVRIKIPEHELWETAQGIIPEFKQAGKR